MERTTMFLPQDLRRRLSEEARRRGESQATLVREALERYLDGSEKQWPLPSFVGGASMGDVDARDAKRWVREQWAKKWAAREASRRE